MKLVGIMCAEELTESAKKIFDDVKVPAYSESSISGFRLTDDNESDNWFADKHAMENSQLLFTMCDDQKAEELLNAIKESEINSQNGHLYAFQLNLEKFIA